MRACIYGIFDKLIIVGVLRTNLALESMLVIVCCSLSNCLRSCTVADNGIIVISVECHIKFIHGYTVLCHSAHSATSIAIFYLL